MADIDIGDNYELDENSSGDLVIRDSTGSVVLQHTDGGAWEVERDVTLNSNDITNINLLETGQITGGGSPIDAADPIDLPQLLLSGAVTNSASGSAGNEFDFERISIADGSTTSVLLGLNAVALILVIGVATGDSAIFASRGGFNDVSEISDPEDSYTTTQGTTGTNIFYDGSEYVIENQTGSSADYDVFVFA